MLTRGCVILYASLSHRGYLLLLSSIMQDRFFLLFFSFVFFRTQIAFQVFFCLTLLFLELPCIYICFEIIKWIGEEKIEKAWEMKEIKSKKKTWSKLMPDITGTRYHCYLLSLLLAFTASFYHCYLLYHSYLRGENRESVGDEGD